MRLRTLVQGVLCRTLQGHGHWVNVLALSTDYVMRTGAFDPANATVVAAEVNDNPDVLQAKAKARYDEMKVAKHVTCQAVLCTLL